MMMTMLGRGAAAVVAGALTVGVLSLGATAAGAVEPVGAVSQPAAQPMQAKQAKQASKKASKQGALKRAKKAEKRARARVARLEKQLQTVQQATAEPRAAYEAAVAAEAAAKGAADANAAATARAKYVVTNENALWDDWAKRLKPVADAATAARGVYDTAAAVVTSIQNQVNSIQTDINSAYTSSQAVFNEINDLQYNQIPNVQGQWNTAWADEQSALATKEAVREDLARRKAQWYDCRITLGRYECKTSAGANWQYVPKLDEVQASLDQWQSIYNQRKNQRQDVEAYLASLNQTLANRQADHANIQNLINGLTSQRKAKEAELPGARAARDAAQKVWDEKRAATDVFYKEADALAAEVKAAKANLPGLESKQTGLNQTVTATGAEVARLAPAYQQAEQKVAPVNEALVKARAGLAKAVERVKRIRKGRGR